MIFVNLSVADLQRSTDFFRALGYSFDPRFTDENAACLVIDENHIYAMLMAPDMMRRFTRKQIVDAREGTEAILALSADSREAVDVLVDKALLSGGSMSNPPDDQGYMYSRSFQDPDGHLWEVLWMDVAAMEDAAEQEALLAAQQAARSSDVQK
ncbi:MAG TPA: VOC family protein [Cryobacterium sp.]|nr:VOC family protein [Cryobacterium sp.]